MSRWPDIRASLDGVTLVRHAILTFQGSWSLPGTGYASIVAQSQEDLCYEAPSDSPSSFGILTGTSLTAPSYKQSGVIALDWVDRWLKLHPNQTFGLGGYSQGGEDAAQACIELQPGGRFEQYAKNFIGGYTFGNPCRGYGFHAPTIADPGLYHGISPINQSVMPWKVDGELVWSATQPQGGIQLWADYVHSKANGDVGMDMYAAVPLGQVGDDMKDVYLVATDQQLNDFTTFIKDMVNDMVKIVKDSGVLSSLKGGLPGLLALAPGAMIELFIGLLSSNEDVTKVTGTDAAVMAAVQGLKFIGAPGGPTAPHVTYWGEIAGYSDMVSQACGFLGDICRLTPARRDL